ncbi:hypothetical protein HF086_003577 [Spodoptera exigua]|uniref:Uncharacterized protein n=1 Tax=Spodoptera exigua TaxID=7107 RepID=A0A922SIL0_SPOEX|nr:hypothetical protein HF086_003577 [Spodoptera exigua]
MASPGYCVEGTLAKTILSEPEEITSMSGQKLPLKMSVDYISFSAHTDYQQTSEFINILKPPHVVLVHGEQNEMSRLKAALQREHRGRLLIHTPRNTQLLALTFRGDKTAKNEMSRLKAALQREHRGRLLIHTPRNTQLLALTFRGDKTAKVMGSLAMEKPEPGTQLQGILVKRNFNYHILAPSDLNKYTELTQSEVTQRQSIHYSGSLGLLRHVVMQLAGAIDFLSETRWRVYSCVDLTLENNMITLEECVIEMLQEMFGDDAVPKMFKGEKLIRVSHVTFETVKKRSLPSQM